MVVKLILQSSAQRQVVVRVDGGQFILEKLGLSENNALAVPPLPNIRVRRTRNSSTRLHDWLKLFATDKSQDSQDFDIHANWQWLCVVNI